MISPISDITQTYQVSLFSKFSPLHILIVRGIICVGFYFLGHIRIFFFLLLQVCILHILNVLECVIEFIWSFSPLSSVLVYHGYINVNIGPW